VIFFFGTRIRFKPTGSVVFFCPQCGGDRHGTNVLARMWFTLMFIPVIPMKTMGEYVQCGTCHTHFKPGVLERPTTASLSQVLTNAVRVLSVMIVGGGDRNHAGMRAAAVRDIRAVVADYDDETLTSDLAAVNPMQAEEYVLPLAVGLEIEGKERFVADLTRVALAGGTITDNQRWLLDTIGRGLKLTPVHVTGIVSSVVAGSSAADAPPAPESPGDPAGETPAI
jgi:hypothetical protein